MNSLVRELNGHTISVDRTYVMIWKTEVWNGEDQDVLNTLTCNANTEVFAGYDRLDGEDYFKSYPDAEIVALTESMCRFVDSRTTLLLKEVGYNKYNGLYYMSDARIFTRTEFSDGSECLIDVVTGEAYPIIRRYMCDGYFTVIYEVEQAVNYRDLNNEYN